MKNVIGPKVLQPATRWYEEHVDDADDGDTDAETDANGPGDRTTDAPTDSGGDPEASPAAVGDDPSGPAAASTPRAEVEVETSDDHIVDLRDAPSSESLASAKAAEAFFAGPDAGELPEPAPEVAGSGARELAESALAAGQAAASKAVEIPKTRLQRIKDIGLRVKGRIKEHNLAVVAAGIAFWGLLAIPAVFTAVLS